MLNYIKGLGQIKLDGELRWISTTLLVILMVNRGEFRQHISMENCHEFLQHTLNNFIRRLR